MDRTVLRDDLVQSFSRQEFQQFCQRLGLDAAALGGREQADKVSSLIGKMERNGRLDELVNVLVQERPTLADHYDAVLRRDDGARDSHLEWLDGLAAGAGPAIEEPPTMRWESGEHREDEQT